MQRHSALHSDTDAVERTPIVVACCIDRSHHARLIDALRGRAEIRLAANFGQLTAILKSTIDAIDVVVVPGSAAQEEESLSIIRRVVADRPTTAIVGYCQAGTQFSASIRSLALAGVHQFLFAGIDDTGVSLRTVLDAAKRQCAGHYVMRQMATELPAILLPILEAALSRPDSVVDVLGLARALGMHRKTLVARCTRAQFVGPAELLRWIRLALVAHLLETTGCAIGRIAIDLSFPSDTALRNLVKRYTGIRPGELRAAGGLAYVIQCLNRRVAEATSGRRIAPGVTPLRLT
jgi:AraC-like DNA-binding protein